MAEPRSTRRWEGWIEYLAIDLGFTADEVAAEFDLVVERSPRAMERRLTRAGEKLDWASLHDQRRIRALIESICGTSAPAAPPDTDWQDIGVAFWRWSDRDGNYGKRPPKDELLAEADMGRDRFDAALRRHGVTDARRLRSVLRTSATARE